MADTPADVLIIGAGASGAVAAKRFVDAGMRVVCLEQGSWPDPAAYPGAGDDWELRGAKQWSGNPAVRAAPADYPLDLAESDFGVLNFNGVGGGTVLYNAQWPRMLPDDFRVRTVDGVADDWPLTYAELQPFYEETDRQFGVSGLGGNPLYPPGADPPLPPLPIGTLATRVARAHARLGWHWWPETNAILSAPYAGRHVCVQRGTCGYGCNEGARHVRERLGHTASWVLICEDLPEASNRVELSPSITDDAGLPAPKLVYRTSENTKRLMDWHTQRAKESLEAAGASNIEVIHHRANGHLMGTARMGNDPASSVVDRWGIAHDVPNLLIVDGSVFVTAGSANPTSTIAALALRAADHLVTSRRNVPAPAHASRPVAAARSLPRRAATPVAPPIGRLDAGERERLAALADRLIPAADGMPAASAVGVHLIDRVIAARPDLLGGLHTALALALDDALRDSRIRYAVAAAYYLSPVVRTAIEYRATDPVPVRADVYPDYIADGLLDHLLAASPAKEI